MSRIDIPPSEIVRILLETASNPSDDHRNRHLAMVQQRFVKIGQSKFAALGDDLQDALVEALTVVSSRDALERIEDRSRFWAWADQVFVNKALDRLNERGLRWSRQVGPPRKQEGDGWQDTDNWIASFLGETVDTLEALVDRQRTLAKLLSEIERSPVGRLRILEGLTEEETAMVLGLTRDQVAGRLKRLRKKLRRLLGN